MEIDRDDIYIALYRRFGQTDLADIDDAVSTSHIAAWRARESGTAIYNVQAFCTCVAKRALIRNIEWQRRHIYPDRDEMVDWAGVHSMDKALQHDDDIETKVDAGVILDTAPDLYSDILRMYYLEGKTLEEVASIMNLTPECVRKRHERALKWARSFFKE